MNRITASSRLLYLLVLCLLPLTPVAADHPGFELRARHQGANDPETEGFSTNDNGRNSTSAVFGDMGLDAWNQTDPAGFARYDLGLSGETVAGMQNGGWHGTAVLRNRRPDTVPGDLGAGWEVSFPVGQFTLLFGSDSAGNPLLSQGNQCCVGEIAPISLDSSITGDGYHTYEMIYDPTVNTTQVQVKVDGIDHGFLTPPAENFGNRLTFGASNATGVDVNWNLVELLGASSVHVPVKPLLVGRHTGAIDPETEGWSTNDNGRNSTGPVFDDMGLDAWNQTDPAGFARYDRGIPSDPFNEPGDQAGAMLERGWRATATLRYLRPDTVPGDLGAGLEISLANLGQYTLLFGADAAGNPLVSQGDMCCLGEIQAIALDPSISGDGYHTYEMVYKPDVNATEVELLVDGISHGFLAAAPNNFGDRFTFGASNGTSANVNWNLIELTIIPEPSTAVLLLVAAAAASLRRRH